MMGGNQNNTRFLFEEAKFKLNREAGKIIKAGGLYKTAPWGTSFPFPFFNQALELSTTHSAEKLLKVLLGIEKNMGRERTGILNEPRGIDLDILYFGEAVINLSDLIIPHPRMHLRRFVMQPLADDWPEWRHPVLEKSNTEILRNLDDTLWVEKITDGI